MPKENEIKLKVSAEDIAHVKSVMSPLTGDAYCYLDDDRFETNILFDHPTLKLKENDQVLRLRIIERGGKFTKSNFSTGARGELTAKGSAARVLGYSSRDEVNVHLEGVACQAIRDLLKVLNFVPTFTYQKKRQSYFLVQYGAHIEIDEVPYLGTFIEIEGKDKEQIEHIMKQYGLENAEQATGAYPTLLRAALRERGMPEIVAAFSGAEGISSRFAE